MFPEHTTNNHHSATHRYFIQHVLSADQVMSRVTNLYMNGAIGKLTIGGNYIVAAVIFAVINGVLSYIVKQRQH